MSAQKIPAASAVVPDAAAPSAPLTVDEIVEQLKGRTAAELFKILKAATALAEKASKVPTKKGTKKATKKDSNVPLSPEEAEKAAKRGAQLVKPREWVVFVGNDARANGWPAFPAKVTTKDKVTGLKTTSMQEMPASEEKDDGVHVFPDGTAFNHKHAMSLSKSYWVAKTKSGTRQDLYEAFEAQYVAPAPKDAAAAAAAESDEETTDESKEEEVVPAAAKPKPAAAKPKKAVKPKAAATADAWVAPKDGKFAKWTFNGRELRRNKDNYVTGTDADGEDEWLGQYNPATNEIEECDVPEDLTA